MRRFGQQVAAGALNSFEQCRQYAPPEPLKKLFATDFMAGSLPLSMPPSDSSTYAVFLFRAAEQSKVSDAVLSDLQAIDAARPKLPVLWERGSDIAKIDLFSAFSPPTLFVLRWMQANHMLDLLPRVRAAFEALLNAQRRKAVATITVPRGSAAGSTAVSDAKKAAQQLHADIAALKGHSLDFVIVEDKELASGFSLELGGHYVNQGKGILQTHAQQKEEVDFLNVQWSSQPPKRTAWPENIETEYLATYLQQLAQLDMEEALNGV